MNIFAVVILLTIIIEFILNITADRLNLKRLTEELPEAFQGVYGIDQYRKSQAYLRENTRFDWMVGTFNTAVILAFWFLKGFPYLDRWVRSFGWGPIRSGLLYMGVLLLVKALLSLPFRIYGVRLQSDHTENICTGHSQGADIDGVAGRTPSGGDTGFFPIRRG